MSIFARFFSNDWFRASQQDDKDNSERPDLSRLFNYLQDLNMNSAKDEEEDEDNKGDVRGTYTFSSYDTNAVGSYISNVNSAYSKHTRAMVSLTEYRKQRSEREQEIERRRKQETREGYRWRNPNIFSNSWFNDGCYFAEDGCTIFLKSGEPFCYFNEVYNTFHAYKDGFNVRRGDIIFYYDPWGETLHDDRPWKQWRQSLTNRQATDDD
jgi:hypothetical protein